MSSEMVLIFSTLPLSPFLVITVVLSALKIQITTWSTKHKKCIILLKVKPSKALPMFKTILTQRPRAWILLWLLCHRNLLSLDPESDWEQIEREIMVKSSFLLLPRLIVFCFVFKNSSFSRRWCWSPPRWWWWSPELNTAAVKEATMGIEAIAVALDRLFF